MLFAPIIADELDPTEHYPTTQKYYFRYLELCKQLGLFVTESFSNDEIRGIDYQIAQEAKKRGLSNDDIELIIWFASPLAQRLYDNERDVYAQSFTLETVSDTDDEPDKPMSIFVDFKGDVIDSWETYSVHYGFPS